MIATKSFFVSIGTPVRVLFIAALLSLPMGCKEPNYGEFQRYQTFLTNDYDSRLATAWIKLIDGFIKANKIFGPSASRSYAYVGIGLWEAIYNGIPSATSLAGQINDFNDVPAIDKAKEYDWGSVLASTMRVVVPVVIDKLTPSQLNEIDRLADAQLESMLNRGIKESTIELSIAFGIEVGNKIVSRATIDGRDVIRNIVPSLPNRSDEYPWYFDKNVNPAFPPVEPLWGTLLTFCIADAPDCDMPPPNPYSSQANSAFYLEADEILKIPGTDEQKRQAFHWEDGPGRTTGQVGHWINIATQIMDQTNASLGQRAKTYYLLGLAASDIHNAVWYQKYKHFLINPVTYINETINPAWKPLVTTPPFPDHISIGAAMGKAGATILKSLYGDIGLTDRTNLGTALYTPRNPLPAAPFILPERYLSSLTKAGDEAAESQIIGGINFRSAVIAGISCGECVSNRVLTSINTVF
jgi:hypothetical protein